MKSINEITSKIVEYFKSCYESNEGDASLRSIDKREETMDDMKVNKEVFVEEENDKWSELEASFTSQPKSFLIENDLKASYKLDKSSIKRQLDLQGQLVTKSSAEVSVLDEKVPKEQYKTNSQQSLESRSQSVTKSFKVTDASHVDVPNHCQANTQQVKGRGRGS